MMGRGWSMAIACMILLGCATTQTQAPAVNVTGRWVGEWATGSGSAPGSGEMSMTLHQVDRHVTGEVFVGAAPHFSGPARGTVNGDILSISYPGSAADLTVRGNEMSGFTRRGNRITLRRQ